MSVVNPMWLFHLAPCKMTKFVCSSFANVGYDEDVQCYVNVLPCTVICVNAGWSVTVGSYGKDP